MTTRERFDSALVQYAIPPHMHDGLRAYVFEHRPVGDFLTAVLSNDLYEAVARADDENIHILPGYVRFLFNAAPSICWGSEVKVIAWLTESRR